MQRDGWSRWRRRKKRWQSAVFVGSLALSSQAVAEDRSAYARAVEGRLFAPCCWVQTLDVHESPLATELRAEIETRLRHGEASETIEDDLAARYGEKIRAVPRGKDPRNYIPLGIGLGMLTALLLLVLAVRSWVARSRELRAKARAQAPTDRSADAYDDKLDEALAGLDDA